MRDPATRIDPNLKAAREDAHQLLKCYVPLGFGPPDETDAARRHRETFNYVHGSQDMPDPIRAHLLELLAKKRRSERTRYTANRNLWLALAVERMRDLGFDPTRSTFTKPAKGEKQSGSKIVRTVLAQHFGINLSERTIEDAWTDYKARLPFRAHPLRKK
jgi:hypothetical protein